MSLVEIGKQIDIESSCWKTFEIGRPLTLKDIWNWKKLEDGWHRQLPIQSQLDCCAFNGVSVGGCNTKWVYYNLNKFNMRIINFASNWF